MERRAMNQGVWFDNHQAESPARPSVIHHSFNSRNSSLRNMNVLRDTKYVLWDTRYVLRDTRYVLRDTRYVLRDTRYVLRATKSVFRKAKNVLQDTVLGEFPAELVVSMEPKKFRK